MVISRKHFDLNEKCVIEKVVIQTPFRYGAIFQNEACFVYVKSGASIFSSPTEQLKVQVNESLLLRCGNYFADMIRTAQGGTTCEIYAIHLYPEILKDIYKDEIPAFIRSDGKTAFARKVVNDKIIDKFVESLTFYFENPELVDDELLILKLKELIHLLLKSKSADTIGNLIAHLFNPRQATIAEIINTHLYADLSIEHLARLANMSLSSFKREFKKQYKDTPANYIKEKRLDRAAELLRLSDQSISEIGFKSGFSDLAHFSRSFRTKYSISPSDYRHSLKKA